MKLSDLYCYVPTENTLNKTETEREEGILKFQLRILDYINYGIYDLYRNAIEYGDFSELARIPKNKELNSKSYQFLRIIDSNLDDFIKKRLPNIRQLKKMNRMIRLIEEIYKRMVPHIRALIEYYDIIIDILEDSYLELPVDGMPRNMNAILYSGEREPVTVGSCNRIFAIQIPKEIFTLKTDVFNDILTEFTNKNPLPRHPRTNLYNVIRKCDYLVRTPVEPYDTIVQFIHSACVDEEVNSIFITIYRVGRINSPIIQSLCEASEKYHKNVFAYVEVNARGDESLNRSIASELEKHKVFVKRKYSNDIKVHAKMFLAIRKSGTKVALLSTGNFNVDTADQYVDYQYFTSDPCVTTDVLGMFLAIISDNSLLTNTKNVFFSPNQLKNVLLIMINEITNSTKENRRIWIKCNHLCEDEIVKALYKAKEAGVDVRLLIRTSCSVDPNKIRVRSKVGELLEHDRFFIIGDYAFISSSDLLRRNMDKRVEFLCEMKNEPQKRILEKQFLEIWNSDGIHEKGNAWDYDLLLISKNAEETIYKKGCIERDYE